ncbi:MAG: response regulator transcription factor [Candidatus Sericytochromatia bacterium]|nr:response regulator transcription factor [Candidatus Tanganyikabacteria bacterium]
MPSGANATILLVDDDPDLLDVVETNLTLDGYSVLAAASGREALGLMAREPEVIILDLMMPEMSGIDLCGEIRKSSDVPILILTARESFEDKQQTYAAGADDYMTKPFDPRELSLRVGALRKRRPAMAQRQKTGHFTLYPETHEVRIGTNLARLSPVEYKICEVFIRHATQVVSLDQLLTSVWGSPQAEEYQVVRVHINNLRRKIEPDPSRPTYVRTVRNVGYQFLPTGELD